MLNSIPALPEVRNLSKSNFFAKSRKIEIIEILGKSGKSLGGGTGREASLIRVGGGGRGDDQETRTRR